METLQFHFTWRKPVKRWDVFLLARCQSSSRPMQVGHRRDSWPLRLGHLEIWCQNWGLWGCEDWRPLFRIHHFQNGLIWKCLKFATEIKFPLPEVNPSQTHNSGGAGGPYQGQSDSSVAGSKMGSEDGLQRRGPSKQSTFAIGSLYCFCYDILIFPLLTSPELWRLLNLLFLSSCEVVITDDVSLKVFMEHLIRSGVRRLGMAYWEIFACGLLHCFLGG